MKIAEEIKVAEKNKKIKSYGIKRIEGEGI